MTQKQLIKEYLNEFGSILPAKIAGVVYKGTMFGSETSKRCREMRASGELRSEGDGKFERFYLLGKKPLKEFIFKTTATTSYCCFWNGKNGLHSSNCQTLKIKENRLF